MINGKKTLALIPARGGSKGLPRKNLRELCGRPLLGWPIEAAKGSKYIDKIVVSSEDAEIIEKAVELGAEAPFVRPMELAGDTASSASVVEHALDFFLSKGSPFDYIALLEPTSPLTETADIDMALETLESKRAAADSIVGVSKVTSAHPAFDVRINVQGLIEPYFTPDFSSAGRRQDMAEIFFLDGTLYISDAAVFLQRKSFYHGRTLPYVTAKWKSFEIDDIVDFICVEAIIKHRGLIKNER